MDLHEWFAQANIYLGMALQHFAHHGSSDRASLITAHEWQMFLEKQLAQALNNSPHSQMGEPCHSITIDLSHWGRWLLTSQAALLQTDLGASRIKDHKTQSLTLGWRTPHLLPSSAALFSSATPAHPWWTGSGRWPAEPWPPPLGNQRTRALSERAAVGTRTLSTRAKAPSSWELVSASPVERGSTRPLSATRSRNHK